MTIGALAGACDGGRRGATGPLPVTATVSLAPAEYVLLRGADIDGAVRFPAADANGAQYLVVGQFATGTLDLEASVQLTAGGVTTAASVVAGGPELSLAAQGGAAQRFHELLRGRERAMSRARAAGGGGEGGAAAPRVPQGPPVVGAQRTFKVCSDLQCSALVNVPATAKYVGAHAAVFVDDSAPAGGFTQSDLDQFGAVFDATLYPIDVAAFGAESDIDVNGVVIILLTRKVNALVPRPDCEREVVTGYFYGADLAPGLAASHNNGEVFYGFVPDTGATISCAYTVDQVRSLLPVTFIHEFQHMISFNQHFLVRGGETEVLWLNEALSHLAEELGGLHYDSAGQADVALYYYAGDFYNAFQYLKNPNANVMVSDSPPGSLASRGGEWLFVRYLADRFGMNAIHQLVGTNRTGATNAAFVTGQTLQDLLGRWALALYTSDLPSFTAPTDLSFELWDWRAAFGDWNARNPSVFNRPFPLVPATGNPTATISGVVTSGSGVYALLTQPAGGAGFDLTFRGGNGAALPPGVAGQLAIVRIR